MHDHHENTPDAGNKAGVWLDACREKAHVVETTGSHNRLNIMGALNLNDIDSLNICQFFIAIRETYPITQKVHVILDGAGYRRAKPVQNWAVVMNIELHYLPPYSPNLNPIERLWKEMNELVRNSHYFATAKGVKENICHFFSDTLLGLAGNLSCRINDHFQKMKKASSS